MKLYIEYHFRDSERTDGNYADSEWTITTISINVSPDTSIEKVIEEAREGFEEDAWFKSKGLFFSCRKIKVGPGYIGARAILDYSTKVEDYLEQWPGKIRPCFIIESNRFVRYYEEREMERIGMIW